MIQYKIIYVHLLKAHLKNAVSFINIEYEEFDINIIYMGNNEKYVF